ncbi:LysR family transcriptional regulator [Bacillus sp. ISL-40]|uniref:LysR family transcriptional regulator n=1 Tax=unclassified Bacillus (in: firmicutes) TaxID=185979 RepID=UPI001BE73DFD|nr:MULTISPECIES: LysR family transcriptional regulator [unclassified Bacillus (in: firmicutes)]MBT2700778.1 LysR family transcriptional regulator [Bacillus sp. ISL-40]MBT2742684.1 LysR family transcriptional regulator [Bacillus sp. ISL-77]
MDQLLSVFISVADKRNFSRAAEELHMTQPAVSQQIQQLEKYIGAKLLLRTNKNVQLTKAGEIVYLHAKEITALYKRMSMLVNELNNEPTGLLKIGASYTFGEYVLPHILATMKYRFPNIIPSVQIGNTRDIAKAILSHEIDVGIVEGEISHRNIYIKTVSTDQMYIVAGGKYPISIYFNKEVTQRQVEQENWIVREEGSGTRDATEKLFETLQIRPTRLMEFGSTQLIKEAVEAGLGISYLSELTVKKERLLGTIQVLNVKGTPIKRNFSVITETVDLHTKTMNLFIELIEDYLKNQ